MGVTEQNNNRNQCGVKLFLKEFVRKELIFVLVAIIVIATLLERWFNNSMKEF